MIVLGIESSADETSAAVVENGQKLLSNVTYSSIEMTKRYGGIVPEVAARSHLEVITPVIHQALEQASLTLEEVDAIGVTRGPGLLGSLLIGSLAARSLAFATGKPLYGVDHVLAHVYANFITDKSASKHLRSYQLAVKPPQFPALALIVSGGHTQLVLLRGHFDYELLGKSQDDAIGEAFDKVARILGLPQPGGPSISKIAGLGNPDAIKLPIAKMPGLNFSFSGLKTAVLRAVQELAHKDYAFPSHELSHLLNGSQKADVAASFQQTAVRTVVEASSEAVAEHSPKSFLLAGGVAANSLLRQQIASQIDVPLSLPDIQLCTDNAAMIASLSYYAATSGVASDDPCSLGVEPALKM